MEHNASDVIDIVTAVINVFFGVCTLLIAVYLFKERKERHNAAVIDLRLKNYRVIVDYLRHIGDFFSDFENDVFVDSSRKGFNEFRYSVEDSRFIFGESVHSWLRGEVMDDVAEFISTQSQINDTRYPKGDNYSEVVAKNSVLLLKISDSHVSRFISLIADDLKVSLE